MFKPKYSEYEIERKPRLTYFLISLCVGIYFIQESLKYLYGMDFVRDLFYVYGFSVSSFLQGNWWNPVTSIFLHASPDHLILNILALYFFGRVIEQALGTKKYLLIFFLSSLVGDLLISLTVLLGISSAFVPTVGASGAIFGLMGTAMLIRPLEFVFYPYLIPVPLVLVALLYTLYNIAAFLLVLATGQESQISYAAHMGGLLVGLIFGLREEGSRKGLLIALIFLIIILLIPFVWTVLSYLEIANYISTITKLFG